MSYDPTSRSDEPLDDAAAHQEAAAAAAAAAASPPPPARSVAGGPDRKTLIGAGIGAAVIALGAMVGINLAGSGADDAAAAADLAEPAIAADDATGAPAGAPGAMPGGGTSGTVEDVDGSTITLTGQDGSSVTVTTADDTVVALGETGSADDIDEGDQVLVMGAADGDTIAAERVIDQGDAAPEDADQAGPPGGMSGHVSGGVTSVDGDTFTVSTDDGAVTVTMTDATTVVVERQGSVDDLESGDTVMVRGEDAEDGSVSASRIIAGDLPEGAPAMGGSTGAMPGGPPMQGDTAGQMPAVPGGTTGSGSAGQPAGVPDSGGAATA